MQFIENNALPLNISPIASGYNYYTFGITSISVKQASRTKAHHPNLSDPPTSPAMQSAFNAGSENYLLVDSDGCVPDNDSRLYNGAEYTPFNYADDVAGYKEFFVSAAQPETFPEAFSSSVFNDIQNPDDRDALFDATFADIKVVLNYYDGLAVSRYESTKVIVRTLYAANGLVLVHENLHNCGLTHRAFATNGRPCNNPGTGPNGTYTSLDDYAILSPNVSTYWGGEMNRWERSYLGAY